MTLNVQDDHQLLGTANSTRTLTNGRLTIGRGPENDWILPDPERIISKQHCVIEISDGAYSLTDTSSNGVFVNSSDTPVGRGNKVVLSDGDHFRISHFRIEVSVDEARETAPLPETGGEHDPFGESGFGEVEGERAFADVFGPSDDAGETSSRITGFSEFDEPFDGGSGAADDPGVGADSLAPDQEYFRPPEAIPEEPIPESHEAVEIPDDWDAEWQDAPAGGNAAEGKAVKPDDASTEPVAAQAAATVAHRGAPQPSAAQAPPLRPPPQSGTVPGGSAAISTARNLMMAFLEGAALDELKIPDENAEEMMRLLGALFRETVSGLREVLAARSSIKSEFRLSQTMIQPVENNPLKFSLGDDDAMTALLTKTGQGYLPPQRAMQEAFADVKAHQVAVMVGMQAALSGLLARFDPQALEARISQESSAVGDLLKNKKSRYWDAFAALYATIAAEAEDDFQSAFGREFGKAYDSQSRKQTGRN